ncbi:TPA: hypothetical protein ACH3X1_014399 [Trebouxia sp. C0004]
MLAPTYLPGHEGLSLPMTSSSPNMQQHNVYFLLCRSTVCLSMHCGSTGHLLSSSSLQSQGMPEPKVKIKAMYRANQNIDITVASQDLRAGDTVLRIPEHLIITLKGVFEDEAMAELLTTDKLSELACVTLYMMYEKMNGKKSRWHHYIKELDRQRGRGQMGAKSPLLWEEGQVESLLAGSPVVNMVKDRLKGIEKEYQELDTVWFMAGSLFRNYPYDIPTEAFSLQLFTQAFATVQASIVHLQDVTLSKRFALVPLGPPLLSYSSTSKAMLKYDSSSREVRLTVDRDYQAGACLRYILITQSHKVMSVCSITCFCPACMHVYT